MIDSDDKYSSVREFVPCNLAEIVFPFLVLNRKHSLSRLLYYVQTFSFNIAKYVTIIILYFVVIVVFYISVFPHGRKKGWTFCRVLNEGASV